MDTSNIENIIYALTDSYKFEKAHQTIDNLFSQTTEEDKLFELKGYIYYQQRELSKSIECYKKAISINENNTTAIAQLVEILSINNNLTEAKELILGALNISPDNLDFLYQLAYIEFSLKNYDRSIQICDKVIVDFPLEIYFLGLRASNYSKQKKYLKAIEDSKKVTDFHLNSKNLIDAAMCFQNIGYYYSKIDEFSKAKFNLQRSLDINPGQAYPNNNLGFIYYKEGNNKKALQLINESLEIDPTNSYAYKNRALVYLALKEMEKAKTDLITAQEMGYKDDYDDEVEKLIKQYFAIN